MTIPQYRFPQFKNAPPWKEKKLGFFLQERLTRNKKQSIKLVLTVNNKKGVIPQQEQFGDYKLASKDLTNYKIVKKGDFAYNPSRINVGSIGQLNDYDVGIVSPIYSFFFKKRN